MCVSRENAINHVSFVSPYTSSMSASQGFLGPRTSEDRSNYLILFTFLPRELVEDHGDHVGKTRLYSMV